MENLSLNELREQYEEWSTEALLSLLQEGTLTQAAKMVAREELESRGIPAAELDLALIEEQSESEKKKPKVPLSLQIIAVVFILFGMLVQCPKLFLY